MSRYAYIRGSLESQAAMQRSRFEAAGVSVDAYFEDVCSSVDPSDADAWKDMLGALSEGDEVVVASLSAVSRDRDVRRMRIESLALLGVSLTTLEEVQR